MTDESKIKLDRNSITLLTPDKTSFELEPACRFVRTSDGGPDPHGLVGQIKYETEVKALNTEVYLKNSIIYGETAYEVEPGFIGAKKELIDRLSDTELLARFLLHSPL